MRRLVVLLALMAFVVIDGAPAEAVAHSVKFPCKVAGLAQLDPILNPDGSPSGHLHMFAGNLGVPSGVHDYATAIQQATTCTFAGDTAAYWVAPMIRPDGSIVSAKVIVYYDRMTSQRLTAFPPDFGMIWGYVRGLFSSKQRSYYGWNCDNTEPLQPDFANVDCRGMPSNNVVTFRAFAPYCWDGITPDTRNYGDHVFYPTGYPKTETCPTGTTVLPRLRVNFNFQIQYCPDCSITSDVQFGTMHGASGHVDFWNVWNQPALQGLVDQLNT